VTTICCMSAAGHYVPPMLIFPRKRVKPQLKDRAPVGAVSAASPTGWVNEDIFDAWFDHFLQSVQPNSRQPTLLILDGHSCHTKNLSVIIKARENNVKILSLPSHCTHKLQPLDVSFFKSANSFYDSAVQNWIRQHYRPVSEWQIAGLFAEAYNRAANAKNAQNGFAECGIHPYNPNKFDNENFLPSELTDRPEEAPAPSTSTSAVTSMPARASPSLSENEPSAAELSCSKPTESLATCTINDRSLGNAEFPASSAPIVVEIVDVNGVSRIQHFEAGEDVIISMDSAAEENVLTTEHPVIEPSSSPTTFRDLVPVPRLSSRQNASKRKRTVNHAELLTASPYKTQLELNRSVKKTPQQAVSKRSKQNKNKTTSLPPNTDEVHVQANINEKSVKIRA
jgi:hypothetical protein